MSRVLLFCTSLILIVGHIGIGNHDPGGSDFNKIEEKPSFIATSPKRITELKYGWKFISSDHLTGCENPGYNDITWETVTLPHTWHSLKDQSDFSNAWYRLAFDLTKTDAEKRIYIRFDGAGISATIYMNGVKLTRHVGSYTAFIVEVTDELIFGGTNVLAVMCDSKNDIAGNLSRPLGKQNRYWCVPGGLNRMVWLIKTDPCHINPQHFASSGIYINSRSVTSESVSYEIKTMLRNAGGTKQTFKIKHIILNKAGNRVGEITGQKNLEGHSSDILLLSGKINKPDLWSTENPSLYLIKTFVEVNGKRTDSLETKTGFRSLSMDKYGNFILHGKKIQLIGASIHEMHEKHFSAVLDEDIDEYLSWFTDIGFNCVFLSHYPPHKHVLDITDSIGLMSWVEDGYVNGSYEKDISANIVREMIYQNWNHPSVFCWSLGNETSVDMWYAVHELVKVARSTGETSKLYTVNQDKPNFIDPNLNFVSISTFNGWYRNSLWDNTLPYINQHGAGGLVTQQQSYTSRSFNPNKWDPEGYQQIVAETASSHIYKENSPNKLFFWWEMREHGEWQVFSRLNAKGLVTFGGYKKDAYYLFKSLNKPQIPLIHICGKHWFIRDVNELKVYSNLNEINIQIKYEDIGLSQSLSRQPNLNLKNGQYRIDSIPICNVFLCRDIFKPGRNEIVVSNKGGPGDTAVVYFMRGDGEQSLPIKNLHASNGSAEFINMPIREQHPFYSQFDGNANNTWDRIPEIIKGTSWISTRRQSHPDWMTDLAFTAINDIDVFIVADAIQGKSLNSESQWISPRWLAGQGFTDTGVRGQWRSNYFLLKDFVIMKRTIKKGEQLKLHPDAEPVDWVCLIRTSTHM